MRVKKVTALLLAGAMCLSLLAGCGNSNTETQTPAQDTAGETGTEEKQENAATAVPEGKVPATGTSDETLKVACDGEPTSIFPNYVTNKTSNRVDSCLFDTLVRWNDEEKKAYPSLATEWNFIDDTHVEFTLRDDVYFSNGELMTANDVKASLQASLDYTLNHYSLMFDMENTEVVDDTHIIVALSRPYGNLPEILGCTYYAIFSEKAFEEVGKDETVFAMNPVGSGPYVLDSWQTGEKMTLVRNENYWDKENLPYYKYIEFSFIQDPVARATALQSGDVQVAFNLSTNQVEELKSHDNITVNVYEQNVTLPIWFTPKAYPVLADENVRKAILLSLDKELLAQAAYAGFAEPSYSSVTGPASPYYYECEDYKQDVETAKQLIADSGYSAEELTFTTYAVNGGASAHYEVMKAQLAAIGVTLNIETVDLVVMLQHSWNGEIAIGFGENDTWDVGRMLEFADSRIETSWNAYIGEGEEELHALIDAAWAASDEERYDAYAKVQDFLADHYACSTVCDVVIPDAWSADLTGVVYDAHCWPNIYNVRPLVAAE